MGHFKDEHPDTFKARLAPYIATALTEHVSPTGTHHQEIKDWFNKIWKLSCAARYDLGWSFPHIREYLGTWAKQIALGIEVNDLQAVGEHPMGVMETIWLPGGSDGLADRGGLILG